jgi:hypothetical protein
MAAENLVRSPRPIGAAPAAEGSPLEDRQDLPGRGHVQRNHGLAKTNVYRYEAVRSYKRQRSESEMFDLFGAKTMKII